MSGAFRRLLPPFLPAALVVALHGILSLGFDAHSRFAPLDIPVHLAGGLAIAIALDGCFSLAEERSLIHVARPVLRLLLLVSLITTAATAWELGEFTSDWLVDTGAQEGARGHLVRHRLRSTRRHTGCLGFRGRSQQQVRAASLTRRLTFSSTCP